jgi:hypothetical protein
LGHCYGQPGKTAKIEVGLTASIARQNVAMACVISVFVDYFTANISPVGLLFRPKHAI